jgi:hypothetical protein
MAGGDVWSADGAQKAVSYSGSRKRTLSCPHYGLMLDRDLNASLNILRLGLQSLGLESVEAHFLETWEQSQFESLSPVFELIVLRATLPLGVASALLRAYLYTQPIVVVISPAPVRSKKRLVPQWKVVVHKSAIGTNIGCFCRAPLKTPSTLTARDYIDMMHHFSPDCRFLLALELFEPFVFDIVTMNQSTFRIRTKP